MTFIYILKKIFTTNLYFLSYVVWYWLIILAPMGTSNSYFIYYPVFKFIIEFKQNLEI